MEPFDTLNQDVHREIMKYLDEQDLCSYRSLNKFTSVLDNDTFWINYFTSKIGIALNPKYSHEKSLYSDYGRI